MLLNFLEIPQNFFKLVAHGHEFSYANIFFDDYFLARLLLFGGENPDEINKYIPGLFGLTIQNSGTILVQPFFKSGS